MSCRLHKLGVENLTTRYFNLTVSCIVYTVTKGARLKWLPWISLVRQSSARALEIPHFKQQLTLWLRDHPFYSQAEFIHGYTTHTNPPVLHYTIGLPSGGSLNPQETVGHNGEKALTLRASAKPSGGKVTHLSPKAAASSNSQSGTSSAALAFIQYVSQPHFDWVLRLFDWLLWILLIIIFITNKKLIKFSINLLNNNFLSFNNRRQFCNGRAWMAKTSAKLTTQTKSQRT